ncbi:guanine nucleotide binding protein, alpha subunit [Panaeolus papilionaceus]|nr:guanine nucleotide binding protein, alpha subunit [Panaeolus papilionaceus]
MGNTPSRYLPLKGEREKLQQHGAYGDGSDSVDVNTDSERVYTRDGPAKIFLLGTSRSGKTTLLKQRKIIYENGWSETERHDYEEIVSAEAIIREVSRILDIMSRDPTLAYTKGEKWRRAFEPEEMVHHSFNILEEMKADPDFVEALPRNGLTGPLMDSLPYFLDLLQKISRVYSKRCKPEDDDILRLYHKTSGIFTDSFRMNDVQVKFYHVGGAKSERKKWPKILHTGADAIIFCVSLVSYLPIEDLSETSMDESLDVFASITRASSLQATPVLLCFTKLDLFSKAILQTPLTTHFPDYTEGPDVRLALNHIKAQFLGRAPRNAKGRITTHFVNAVETESVRGVFSDLQRVIS